MCDDGQRFAELMRKRASYLALGAVLVGGTTNAQGQTHGPIFIVEAPVTVPSSGVLVTRPPLAPVAVPPSGVLVTQAPTERRTVAIVPIKRVQTMGVFEKTASATMGSQVHQRTGRRHVTTRTLVRKHATVTAAAAGAPAVATITAATPAPAPPPVYVSTSAPVYNWTGLYTGGNLGFGWNHGSFSDPLGNTLTPTTSGQFLGGGQVGLNYQFWGDVLVGAEADFDWLPNTNISSMALFVNPPSVPTRSTASVTVNNRWQTTVTGRLGYAWDRVLLYGKGGGAWVGSNNPSVTINGGPVAVSTGYGNPGWTAGLGVEWAFWGNWSARIEYDFVGLSSQNFTFPVSVGGLLAGDQFSASNRNIQLVNVGTNYKLDSGW
jgi:outer membrane immunogenic protein